MAKSENAYVYNDRNVYRRLLKNNINPDDNRVEDLTREIVIPFLVQCLKIKLQYIVRIKLNTDSEQALYIGITRVANNESKTLVARYIYVLLRCPKIF
jgi:hypothetical protein